MAENFGLSKRLKPTTKDKPVKIPVKVIKDRIPCDISPSCDRATHQVIIWINDNEPESLFYCGHHFNERATRFRDRGYEVVELLC